VKIRRIDFSPDEWIAGTLGMTPEEEGLYIKICALIWSTGGRISEEHLKRCTSAHGNKVNALLDHLEKAGKIVRNGREIGQKRAEKELENAQNRVGKARENGAKGGRPNGLAKPDGSASAKANHQLSTTNHQLKEDSVAYATGAGSAPADPLKAMWDRGKAVLGKSAGSLIGQAQRDHGYEAVIEAITATEHQGAAAPIEYFIACLKQKSRKRSAMEKFYAGAMEAADEFDRQQANGGAYYTPLGSLLDGR